MVKILLTLLFIVISSSLSFGAALDLPKANDGWTIFTPSSDSRIVYVSATGNDSSGIMYTSANHPDWSNPQNPTGTINAFATIAEAWAHIRNGYPDWILIKRGDTLYQTFPQIEKQGRSITQPLLIGAYGGNGLSPLLKIGSLRGIYVNPSGTFNYLAVQGIRFYAHTRNPDDPEYDSTDNGNSGVELRGSFTGNILVEGCSFEYVRSNILYAAYGVGRISNIDFRRNLFLHSYQIEESHGLGLYGEYTENILLDENVFDHNGWLIQAIPAEERPEGWSEKTGGQATIRSQNTYFSAAKGFRFINNISMRSASIHNKHASALAQPDTITVEDAFHDNNLYIDGEYLLDAVGNNPERGVKGNRVIFSNNVAYKIGLSRPTGRNVSGGVGISALGSDGRSAIFNNIILNGLPANDLPDQGFDAVAITLGSKDPLVEGEVSVISNVDVYDNILYGNDESAGGASFRGIDIGRAGISGTIRSNYIRSFIESSYFVDSTVALTGWGVSDNQYYRTGGGVSRVEEVVNTQEQWQLNHEATATFAEKIFTDDTRTVETYLASIGETSTTLEDFYALARSQDRYDWDTRITASAVNSYIRAGFDMAYDGELPPDPPTCSDGIQNGDETGVDCGGSCPACETPSGRPQFFKASASGPLMLNGGGFIQLQ